MDKYQSKGLPNKVEVREADIKLNSEGKKYKYEKDGVFYGGDYLAETSDEVNLDLPPAPKEENPVI
ncbi:MAG: hypothetical protein QG583_760 [Patescibacteria group bacterium]|nr:hypothetical protein [Patescibacteria group bacterium]